MGLGLTEDRRRLLNDVGLLVLRIALGATMLSHGWGKFMQFFGDEPLQFGDPIGVGVAASLALAVFAEVFCSLGLVVGLLTRLACIPLFTTMAVAFFIVHGDDPFGRKELAFVYMFGYLALLLTGPGRFSLDALIMKMRAKKKK